MRTLPAAIVLCLALAGCGTSDDRTQAGSVADVFANAIEQDRGQEACDQLSVTTVEQVESQEERPCAAAIIDLGLEGGAVVATQVFITNAKVDLASGESVFLNREPIGWRITAVGCKPAEGNPRARPLECEVEA
jgi:hypothetical protein